jgi:hypothetical protein
LALTPPQIDEMTPGELLQMHDGYLWRLTHPAPEAVWLVTMLLRMFGGSEIPWTPETLLGMTPKANG